MNDPFSIAEQIRKLPPEVRPIVMGARRTIRAAAPAADEVSYRSKPPQSKAYMWKLVRYSIDGRNVLGIGTFRTYSTIFFYRGRELEDGSGLLAGTGKDSRFITLRSAADAERPAVKKLIARAFRLGGTQP